jgi:long-chain acyl-CoA synthetase
MKEIASSATVDLTAYRNVTDLLVQRLAVAPHHAAFDVPTADGSAWRTVTTAEFAEDVMATARGLIAVGVEPGESVAIMAQTRYEWAVCDLAVWYAAGVVVPIYDTAAQTQVSAIVADADVQVAIGGSHDQAEVLRAAMIERGDDDPSVWTMDAFPGSDLAALTGLGRRISPEQVEARRRLADLDSLATIVYTSGTTSDPKGANLTHRNFVGQVLGVAASYEQIVTETGNTVIFLPLAHVLARALQLICIAKGMRIAHVDQPKQAVASLKQLRPTFLVVVPRVLQKIDDAATQKAARVGLGGPWRAARAAAIQAGIDAEHAEAGLPTRRGWRARVRLALFDRVFYASLRARLGGRIEYLLCGAASLSSELSWLFRGMGIPIVEGYGLTETTAPIVANLPGSIRSGTVGVPLPGSTVRISEAGEVLVRGIGVFAGYRRTEDNVDAFTDGFFRTGDLGALDDSGRLTLRGRLKDVIVTSAGKTIAPASWEAEVEADPLIAHAVLVGEGKPYLGGIILLDTEIARSWAVRHGGDALPEPCADGEPVAVTDEGLISMVVHVVEQVNQRFSPAERARRIVVLLADLSAASGLVTPTMKLKKAVFTERVGAIIDRLYLGGGTVA